MTPLTDKELADLAMRFAQVADGVSAGVFVRQETARQMVSALIELQAARGVFEEMKQMQMGRKS